MSNSLLILIGILLFAFVTAILYMIGLKKKMGEDQELAQKLLNNASLKVIDYLKIEGEASMTDIDRIIKGVRAKNFYSQKTAIIIDSKEFKYQLVDFMMKNGFLIQEKDNKGKTVYKLSNREK